MESRNDFFSTDIRKNGYLMVGRSQLKALYAGDARLRRLANVLLCVQTFAFFSTGQVGVKGRMYVCHPGEWITTYAIIGNHTGLDTRTVQRCLAKLELYGLLRQENLLQCKRIVLLNYLCRPPVDPSGAVGVPPPPAEGLPNLIAGAEVYYSNCMPQEGGRS